MLSLFIAKLIGIIYLSVSIALFLGTLNIKQLLNDFENSAGLRTLAGYITILLGGIIVETHNLWVQDWRVLITLIGWIALVKGILYIVCPSLLFNLSKKCLKNEKPLALITLLLGGLFLYFGFGI